MSDLSKSFGRMVGVHRRKAGVTQASLAEAVDLSIDMISGLESGRTGASFSVIERLADYFQIDPSELFAPSVLGGSSKSKVFRDLALDLAELSEPELVVVADLIKTAFQLRDVPRQLKRTSDMAAKGRPAGR